MGLRCLPTRLHWRNEIYTTQHIHSHRSARANAIYQHALANRPSENLLDPTHRLFARSGYGRISHPDSVFVHPKSRQNVQSRPLMPSGRTSRIVGSGPNRRHYSLTAEEIGGYKNNGRSKPGISATGTDSPGPEYDFSNRIASRSNWAPSRPKASVGMQNNSAAEWRGPGEQAGRARRETDHGFDFEPFETASAISLFTRLLRMAAAGGKLTTKTGPKNVKPPRLKRTATGTKSPHYHPNPHHHRVEHNTDKGKKEVIRVSNEIWRLGDLETCGRVISGTRGLINRTYPI